MMKLRDFVTDCGGVPWKRYVLGNPTTAENIVAWSSKTKAGKTFTRALSWGLTVVAVAAGETPTVYFWLDEEKLADWLSHLGGVELFHLEAMGIGIAQLSSAVEPQLMGIYIINEAGAKPLYKFDWTTVEQHKFVFLGALEIAQDGFTFLDSSEVNQTAIPERQQIPSAKPETAPQSVPTEEAPAREVTCTMEMSPDEVDEMAARWEASVARRRSV